MKPHQLIHKFILIFSLRVNLLRYLCQDQASEINRKDQRKRITEAIYIFKRQRTEQTKNIPKKEPTADKNKNL